MSEETGARPAGWARPLHAVTNFVYKTFVIAELEVRKLLHDPTELITRAVQPALWLLIFGNVFSRVRAIPTGHLRYIDFMAPGILAQSILFIAIFYGIAVIWERDVGILQKFLVSPIPRTALVLGRALSAGVRGISQVVIIYALVLLMGVKINWHPQALAGVILAVLLGATIFSTLSLVIATIVKTRERFMGIGQILTMPLFFASNAIYPISLMPHWLQIVSRVNPLTYEVDALRGMMVVGGASVYGFGLDFGVMFVWSAIMVTLCGWLYPNVVR